MSVAAGGPLALGIRNAGSLGCSGRRLELQTAAHAAVGALGQGGGRCGGGDGG